MAGLRVTPALTVRVEDGDVLYSGPVVVKASWTHVHTIICIDGELRVGYLGEDGNEQHASHPLQASDVVQVWTP